jgi:hypothetical protein
MKRLRCTGCDRHLGAYRVAFTDDGVILGLVRVPPGVKVWKTQAIDWRRNVSALKLLEERYHWTCGCGALPVWRAATLARSWAKRDGTEYV